MLIAIIAAYSVIIGLGVAAFRAGGDAPTWFVGNILAAWFLSAAVFGYPGFIVVATALVAGVFTTILSITWSR